MLDIWSIASTVAKYGSYLGVASVFGFAIAQVLNHKLSSYLYKSVVKLAVTGLISTVLLFFLQVGAFANNGMTGIFNLSLIEMLWSTGNGDLLLWRGVGLLYFIILVVLSATITERINAYLLLPSIFALSWSFTAVGHVSDVRWYWQAFLMLHIFVGLSWVGSLNPLINYIDKSDFKSTYKTLDRYSKIGLWLVSLLLISGSMLIIKLLILNDNTSALSYLLTLAVKLLLVVSMLGFAAYHKLYLGKKYEQSKVDKHTIMKSIKKEYYVAHAVLLTTAGLTTIVGISH